MVPRHLSPISRALSSVEFSSLAYRRFPDEAASEPSLLSLDR